MSRNTLLALLILFAFGGTALADWPMAGANPQRTSWVSEDLPGNLDVEWVKPIESYISQRVQLVGAESKIFISAADGLYAINAADGSEAWVYPTELPLGHSPTYDNGTLYVGGLDCKIHAVDASDGSGIWTSQFAGAGFW